MALNYEDFIDEHAKAAMQSMIVALGRSPDAQDMMRISVAAYNQADVMWSSRKAFFDAKRNK